MVQTWNCPRHDVNVTNSFLSNRLASINSNEMSMHKDEDLGVPQGSRSGPLLFTHGLPEAFKNAVLFANIKLVAYADEISFVTSSKIWHGLEWKIESTVWGLFVSPKPPSQKRI